MEQTPQQIRGEIEYRKKLVAQQVLGQACYFDNHSTSVDQVIQKWIGPQIESLKRITGTLPLDRSERVLELGSENSHLAAYLRNQGYYCVGVDVSFETLRQGAPLVRQALNLQEAPELAAADANNLPFQNGAFGLVFCFATLHHIPGFQRVLREVRRVLKPGGWFFFSEEPISSVIGLDSVYAKLRGIPEPSEVGYGIWEGRRTYFGWTRPVRELFTVTAVRTSGNALSRRGPRAIGKLYSIMKGASSIEVIARKRGA